ncbi:MAG: thioredoxin family protein [Pirellulaceae bacterium]|nr:thioredoxin family protein [Pirellulaceae bacterium]
MGSRFFQIVILGTLVTLTLGLASVRADEGFWQTDYLKAKEAAKTQEKDLFLCFSGSDWDGWSIELEEKILSNTDFQKKIGERYVPVKVDFPQEIEQTQKLKIQNKELGQKFEVNDYPVILLLDTQERPFARTGYREGGISAVERFLAQGAQNKLRRDEAFSKAKNETGLAKARLLDSALSAIGGLVTHSSYQTTIDQILALDTQNEALLFAKYSEIIRATEFQRGMTAAQTLAPATGLAEIERLIEKYAPTEREMVQVNNVQFFLHVAMVDAYDLQKEHKKSVDSRKKGIASIEAILNNRYLPPQLAGDYTRLRDFLKQDLKEELAWQEKVARTKKMKKDDSEQKGNIKKNEAT